MKTEIIERGTNGKVLFHSVEPRKMTFTQIRKECKAWGVNMDNVTIIRS